MVIPDLLRFLQNYDPSVNHYIATDEGKGYDLTKQKSPGTSRSNSQICTRSRSMQFSFTHSDGYWVDHFPVWIKYDALYHMHNGVVGSGELRYPSCIVVRNGGILMSKDYGSLIDAHDVVIQWNNARIKNGCVVSLSGIAVSYSLAKILAKVSDSHIQKYSNALVDATNSANLTHLFEFICNGFHELDYKEHINFDVVHSVNDDLHIYKIQPNAPSLLAPHYVPFYVSHAIVGRTFVLSNYEILAWQLHFYVPVVHHAAELSFFVQNSDVVGSQLICIVAIPVAQIYSAEQVQGMHSMSKEGLRMLLLVGNGFVFVNYVLPASSIARRVHGPMNIEEEEVSKMIRDCLDLLEATGHHFRMEDTVKHVLASNTDTEENQPFKQWDLEKFLHRGEFYNLEDKVDFEEWDNDTILQELLNQKEHSCGDSTSI